MWLTTEDVAKVLDITTRWVRWLARAGELPCEVTESGQRIFRRADIRRVLIQRTEDRTCSRPALLAAVRVRMLKVGYEPRQLAFWRGPGARIVARGERPDPHAEVKAMRSGVLTRRSEKQRYVDRRIAGGRRL